MKNIFRGSVLFIGAFSLALVSSACSSAPQHKTSQAPPPSNNSFGFTGYDIAWTMDQIADFKSRLHAVGKVTSVEKAYIDMGKNFSYNYVNYELEVEQSDATLEGGRVLARQMSLNLRHVGSRSIEVGDTILLIGRLPEPDDFGVIRSVADWMIELQPDGTMDYGNPDDRPRFNDFAAKMGLKPRN